MHLAITGVSLIHILTSLSKIPPMWDITNLLLKSRGIIPKEK
jgi:hypothetical protein